MAKNKKISVKGTHITVSQVNEQDFISLTDIAKSKSDNPSAVIANWMRNRNTIEFLGIWESLYNPDFNPLEFEGVKKEAGLNAFTLKAGRYGGTYAHSDIAFEFGRGLRKKIASSASTIPPSSRCACSPMIAESKNWKEGKHE